MNFSAFLFIFLFTASTVHAAHQPLLMILRFADFLRALFGRAGAGLQHVPSRASLNSGLSFRSASSRLAVAPDVGPGIGRAAEVAARAAAGRAAEAADRVGAGAARAAEVAGRAAAGRVVGPGARAGIRTLPRIGTKTKVGGGLIVGGGAGKLVDDFFLDKKENEAERNINILFPAKLSLPNANLWLHKEEWNCETLFQKFEEKTHYNNVQQICYTDRNGNAKTLRRCGSLADLFDTLVFCHGKEDCQIFLRPCLDV